MTSIPELLTIMKEKQMVEEKDFPFAQEILMDCEKGFEEEKRSIDKKYSKIIEEDYKQYKKTNELLFDRIQKLKKAKSDKEARYEEKIIEFRGRISDLKETERKNDEDLEVETGLQATGVTGVNSVESSQGEDRAIVLCDDPKLVGTSTGNSSGQSIHKDKPETMSLRMMNDSDDDMTLNEIARASKRRGQEKEVHVKGSSNSTQKRKRSMNEGQNNLASE